MSYCRFSSDNWKSDVYAWPDVSGDYVVAVAGRRLVGDLPPVDHTTPETYIATYQAQLAAEKAAAKVDIGLPCDGEIFHEGSLKGLYGRLLTLRGMGYHVPQSALEEVEAEMVAERETRT